MNENLILAGTGMLAFAITPTPDDITIVSPSIQAIIGLGLILWGAFK